MWRHDPTEIVQASDSQSISHVMTQLSSSVKQSLRARTISKRAKNLDMAQGCTVARTMCMCPFPIDCPRTVQAIEGRLWLPDMYPGGRLEVQSCGMARQAEAHVRGGVQGLVGCAPGPPAGADPEGEGVIR